MNGNAPDGVQPTASIVVPSFRSRSTIGATLESLLAQKWPEKMEVIVVDSSDDGTGAAIGRRYPQVRLIQSETRLTPGAARNRGAQASRGRLLGFLDADAVAASDWLKTLADRLKSDERIRLVGGAIVNANPETTASRVQYWIEFSEFHPGHPAGFRPFLSSCNLLLERSVFQAQEGFDSRLGMSEDLLFCRGFQGGIFLETATQVAHTNRQDWPEVLAHLRRLGFWSGRYRRDYDVAGSNFKRFPASTWTLVPYRLARILARARRHPTSATGSAWLLSPRLARGLRAWQKGFREGLGSELQEPG